MLALSAPSLSTWLEIFQPRRKADRTGRTAANGGLRQWSVWVVNYTASGVASSDSTLHLAWNEGSLLTFDASKAHAA